MRTSALVLFAALSLGPSARIASAQGDAARPSAFQLTRTERFLANRLACRGCHQIGGRGGAIGPALDGIRERSEFDRVLSMITDPSGTVPGTLMPRQRMPEREARRLAAYIMTLPALPDRTVVGVPEAAVIPPPADELDGASLYARHCASCHGAEGRGDGWNAPNLPVPPTNHTDGEAMSKRPDDTLYDGIAAGAFVLDRSPLMPAFADQLSPAQIRALVAHIRVLCACEQPAWARGG
jgi:mono/diheme cytochrome c family protein